MPTNNITININQGTKTITGRPGMTLYAILRMNGILLATGCGARGRCGLCKVRVTKGELDEVTDQEKSLLGQDPIVRGWRLGCQARAKENLDIEVDNTVLNAKEYQAIVEKITPLNHDIKKVSLRFTGEGGMPHRAGQFVVFTGKPYGEIKGLNFRAYSLSNPSSITDRADIIVRLVPDGVVSTYVHKVLQEGDAATITGPFGDFVLQDSGRAMVGIAGGSGLSPFCGMVDELALSGNKREFHLFFGAVCEKDLYLVEHFQGLASRYDWFKFTPALSAARGELPAGMEAGLIPDVVSRVCEGLSGRDAYLCGSMGMLDACIKMLAAHGVKDNCIFYDKIA